MTRPFTIKKTYKTQLTLEGIELVFKKKLQDTIFIKYSGTFSNEKFDIYSFKGGLPLKIKGEILKSDLGLNINVVYSPVYNIFFLLIPLVVFFGFALFASSLKINDEVPNVLNRILFCFGGLILFTVLICYMTYVPIDSERRKLEEELQLKPLAS